MLTASIVLLLYAALGGLVMTVGIFRGAKPWVPLALGHGVLGATAVSYTHLTLPTTERV